MEAGLLNAVQWGRCSRSRHGNGSRLGKPAPSPPSFLTAPCASPTAADLGAGAGAVPVPVPSHESLGLTSFRSKGRNTYFNSFTNKNQRKAFSLRSL